MSSVPQKQRRIWFRVLAACLGLLLGIIFTELGLRILDVEPTRLMTKRMLTSPKEVDYHCYPTNPNGEFQALPDTSVGTWVLKSYMLPPEPLPLSLLPETPWCVAYEMSPQKLRDRVYSPEPAAGMVRIGMVGDSFVFGEGVPIERTLSRQTEQLLGSDYEVVNAGRVGAGTELEINVVWDLKRVLNVKRVVFVFLLNDVPMTPELEARQLYINDLIVIRDSYLDMYESQAWYTGPLRLPRLLGSKLTMRNITDSTIQWYLDTCDRFKNADKLDLLESRFHELATIPGLKVAFVIYPLLESLEKDYPFTKANALIAEMSRRAGLKTLDLTPHFVGRQTSSLWVYPTDHHPNGKANVIASEALVEWLKQEYPDFLEVEMKPTPL